MDERHGADSYEWERQRDYNLSISQRVISAMCADMYFSGTSKFIRMSNLTEKNRERKNVRAI
ncbi:MAG: hypothetical protein NVS2B12_29100 [Ktedonobacteraceae bacterium]